MSRIVIAPKDRIILPLDVPRISEALKLVNILGPHVGMFKTGLELIYTIFAELLGRDYQTAKAAYLEARTLMNSIGGPRMFMDVKLSDIPNTVGKASLAVSQMGVAWFNVHASAGIESIKAAVANKGNAKVLGVTVLTSIDPDECKSIFGDESSKMVCRFAGKLLDSGADGIICSPQELKILRAEHIFDELFIVTPGVRPKGSDVNDQKRIMTPGEAIIAGADYLVIGRPITGAKDPVASAVAIEEEIRNAEFMCK